jgi:hypothetical protein
LRFTITSRPSRCEEDLHLPAIEHARHTTKSYVVIMYDVTAAFTHWGMYNISPDDFTSRECRPGWKHVRHSNLQRLLRGGRIRWSMPAGNTRPASTSLRDYGIRPRRRIELAVLGKLPRSRGDVVPSIARGRSKSTRPGKRQYRRVLFVGSI